jgi:antitoxin FitA
MPTTLKLKNIPDEIYERLEASAKVHGRTMSDEAIACLETLLLPARISASERLAHIRTIRAATSTKNIDHRHVDEFKHGSRH